MFGFQVMFPWPSMGRHHDHTVGDNAGTSVLRLLTAGGVVGLCLGFVLGWHGHKLRVRSPRKTHAIAHSYRARSSQDRV
jgi:hypothetical protein